MDSWFFKVTGLEENMAWNLGPSSRPPQVLWAKIDHRYTEFSLQPNQVLKFVAAEALSAVCVFCSRQ